MSEFTVAGFLCSEFELVANSLLERVTGASPQDAGAPGQDTALYDKLMKSLRLVGIADAPIIFNFVWEWRSSAQKRRSPSHNSNMQKTVIDSTFLEASVQLLEDKPYSCEVVLGERVENMEKIVFEWAMFVDVVQTYPIALFRRNIQNAVPRIIGALARGRLEAVSAIFFKEISWRERADMGVRQELLSLCEAMKRVRLSFENDNLFAASLNLIQHADPLRHNIQQKKSQVRHSLSSMMASWLHPLVESPIDFARIETSMSNEWYTQLEKMLKGLISWAESKSKHFNDGFPLIVDVWCLQHERSFVESGDKVFGILKKAMKNINFRCLAVRLITQCARVALVRLGKKKSGQDKAKLDDWLDKSVTDVVQAIKKGPTPSVELHDLIVRMIVTIGWYQPLFATNCMILPIIQNEQLDKITIALRSLLELLFTAISNRSNPLESSNVIRNAMVSLETNSLELQLLEYIRSENNAWRLLKLEDRYPHFAKEISKLLTSFDSTNGIGLTHRGSISDVAKDSPMGINVLAWTLRAIPYIIPDDKTITQVVLMLARYAGHSESAISSVSFRSLKNILVGIPSMRNGVVTVLAQCVWGLSDDHKRGILEGLRNVQTLLYDWLALANDVNEDGTLSQFTSEGLEGIILCFLCSNDASVRKKAYEILAIIRSLQTALRAQESRNIQATEVSMSGLPFHSSALMDPSQATSENPFMISVYVMDVLEQMGNDMAHSVYWDHGHYPDLHRKWKPIPENVSLIDVLCKTIDSSSSIRLARFLSEMAIIGYSLCPTAFEKAYVLITQKLGNLGKFDGSGRISSFSDFADPISPHLLKNYCCFAAGCQPLKNKERIAKGAYSVMRLHQMLINFLTLGSSVYQDIAVLALGNCNPEAYETLANEIQSVMSPEQAKERSRGKQTARVRMEEIRLNIGRIFRSITDRMPRGTLRYRTGLRKRLLDFIENTLHFIRHMGPGSLFDCIAQLPTDSTATDILQLCICLCSVAANAGPELISSQGQDGLNIELRRILFHTMQQWNRPGVTSGDYQKSKLNMRQAVLMRLKDQDSCERVEEDLELTCRYLEVASRLAMVAMLEGAPWDADRRTNNPIFTWVDYLLSQPEEKSITGPSNVSIARRALTKLMLSHPSLVDSYINKCYDGNQAVSSIYFQVLCEVYCAYEMKIEVYVVLSLVLYKCVDEDPQVREDALHLLKCLSHREWGGKCTTGWAPWSNGNSIEDDVIVIGSLQDTCQTFQYTLSESLAREHPEVNEKLCEELMTRQCNEVVNQGVLVCLTPWMERLSFSPGDSEWGDRLLKSMYYVTTQHGKEFSYEIERLWSTVAASRGNVRPILDFLVGFAVKECALQDAELLLQYHSVLKRISLYLARTSPHRTIDHLVSEAAKMMQTSAISTTEAESNSASSPLRFSEVSHSFPTLFRRRDGSASSQLDVNRSAENSATSSRPRPPSFTMTPIHRRESTYTNASISIQSDGSYDEARDLPLVQLSKGSFSNISAFGGERRPSEVSAPILKGLLQRADVAICLLVEVAYERGDEFSDHVPLLFHLCVICMDSLEPVVRLHCQELVINLLNVLLAKRVGVPGKANKLSALVSALQSMKGQPPWTYEDTNLGEGWISSETIVQFFVAGLLEATSDGSNLKDLWIKEALMWAVESSSRHLSCRSFQVLRGLTPKPSSEAFISLVRCLKACFTEPSLTSMECVLEILETMKMLMINAEDSKLILYPQLFWVCITLLGSDYVHIYRLALELLHCLLDSLKISNDMILNVLLATTPTSIKYSPVLSSSMGIIHESGTTNRVDVRELQPWDLGTQILLPTFVAKGRTVLCIQHLLIKGLYMPQSETIAVRLLATLATELVLTPEVSLDSSNYLDDLHSRASEHSGVSVLLGSVSNQIGVSLAAIVPWICQKVLFGVTNDMVLEVCHALKDACHSERFYTVGSTLIDLADAESHTMTLSLKRLTDAICDELTNQIQSMIIGYWLGMLKTKEQGSSQISLMILKSVFERCKPPNEMELSNFPALRVCSDFNVFSLISSHLQGSNSVEAAEVLSAMVACSALCNQHQEPIHQEQAAILSHAMQMGMELHQLIPSDSEHIKNTINGVLETYPQHLKKPSGREFMPFLKDLRE